MNPLLASFDLPDGTHVALTGPQLVDVARAAALLVPVVEATDDLSDDERHALSVLREVLAS